MRRDFDLAELRSLQKIRGDMQRDLDSIDLRSLRKILGETQTIFARRFGVAQPTLHEWETMGLPTRKISRRLISMVLSRTLSNVINQSLR